MASTISLLWGGVFECWGCRNGSWWGRAGGFERISVVGGVDDSEVIQRSVIIWWRSRNGEEVIRQRVDGYEDDRRDQGELEEAATIREFRVLRRVDKCGVPKEQES
jgi:hypothetical protein